MSAILALTITDAERIYDATEDQDVRDRVYAAIIEAEQGAICNDVFVPIERWWATASSVTIRLLDLTELLGIEWKVF